MAVDSRVGGGKQMSLGLLCQEEEKHSDEDGGMTEGHIDLLKKPNLGQSDHQNK